MKIVITDLQTVTDGDLPLDRLQKLGKVVTYPLTDYELIAERIRDADAVICNKTKLNSETLSEAKNLKYIGLFATGYDNIDIEYAKHNGITVCNAGTYSTDAVAQHTFAFILNHFNNISRYDEFVKEKGWMKSHTFSPFVFPLNELAGKTIGLIGYGAIGKKVAQIANSFNMRVLACAGHGREDNIARFLPFDELIGSSDIISVHCPLNESSTELFNEATFSHCKRGAYFINTARGGIINEKALYNALKSGILSGAAIDVLTTEPMQSDCILFNAPNITFTPHIAWAPIETRLRLMDIVADNLEAFLNGTPKNQVNI